MRPHIALDTEQVASNARAWERHLGVPLRPVVKCSGYGWGYAPLVRALEQAAQAFCVSDADELFDVRRFTAKPVVVLGSVAPERLAAVLDAGGIPTIGSAGELAIARDWAQRATRTLHVRVGLSPAAAWSGLTLEQLAPFARELSAADAHVEYWTHVTDMDAIEEQLRIFDEGRTVLDLAGVRVVATDAASTYSALGGARGTYARIGVGLFGAGSERVPGLACALRVEAPVVKSAVYPAGTRVGYGGTMLAMAETVATARAGYGDGVPKTLAGSDDILTIGMQYLTARVDRKLANGERIVLLDRTSHIDRFAHHCGRLSHEVVTAFGNSARANRALEEV